METEIYNPFDNPEHRKLVDSFDPAKLIYKARVSLSDKLEHPPTAIAMGEYNYRGESYPIPFGSYGDISCIVGASKSRKTFFKSALISSYIGGNANIYFPTMYGLGREDRVIIDIDTEQSKYHSQRVFKRVEYMTGAIPEFYICFYLREYTPEQRLKFIEWIFTKSEYSGKIGLMSIDGYADLVTDFNNIDQATDVVTKLMKWSSGYNCHITGVLHKNFGTSKPVGHIGSLILKKAETVAFVENNKETGFTEVTCEYSRNLPFDNVFFEVNNDHLPSAVANPDENIAPF